MLWLEKSGRLHMNKKHFLCDKLPQVMSQESVGKVYRVQHPEATSASTGTRRDGSNKVKICRHMFTWLWVWQWSSNLMWKTTRRNRWNKPLKIEKTNNPKSLYIHFTLLWFVLYFCWFVFFFFTYFYRWGGFFGIRSYKTIINIMF